MRKLLTVVMLLLAVIVAACNVDAPTTAYLAVPSDIMPPVAVNPVTGDLEPAGTAEQYLAFVDWTANHAVASDDDMPDKATLIQGPSYCQQVTDTLSWCTQADGNHHWETPSGCYDLHGNPIGCW